MRYGKRYFVGIRLSYRLKRTIKLFFRTTLPGYAPLAKRVHFSSFTAQLENIPFRVNIIIFQKYFRVEYEKIVYYAENDLAPSEKEYLWWMNDGLANIGPFLTHQNPIISWKIGPFLTLKWLNFQKIRNFLWSGDENVHMRFGVIDICQNIVILGPNLVVVDKVCT